MNAKFNLWTLLFAASAAWNVYTATQSKASAANVEPETTAALLNSSSCPPDSVPYSKGDANTKAFSQKGFIITSGSTTAINPDVNQFILPRCELQEMLKFGGVNDSVIAQLAISPARDRSQQDTIDLYFKVMNGQNQARYFDFTEPCPPRCPKNQ